MKTDEGSTGNQDETPTGNETPYDVYIYVLMFKESKKTEEKKVKPPQTTKQQTNKQKQNKQTNKKATKQQEN